MADFRLSADVTEPAELGKDVRSQSPFRTVVVGFSARPVASDPTSLLGTWREDMGEDSFLVELSCGYEVHKIFF